MHFLDLHHHDAPRPGCRYSCVLISGVFLKQPVATLVTSRNQSLLVNAITGETNCEVILALKKGLSALAASVGEVKGVCDILVREVGLLEKVEKGGGEKQVITVRAYKKKVHAGGT